MTIPRFIHQTCNNRDSLPTLIEQNISNIRRLNPNWNYQIYNAEDRENFIRDEYGNRFLELYLKINEKYGASRADYFRYLLMFKKGGVYLDIKSGMSKRLDDVLRPEDNMVVSQWPTYIDNVKTEEWGNHKQLTVPEFQNWFLICSQQNPLMYEIVERVTSNLEKYNPFFDGVGRKGVLKTTGPIIFTKTIIESEQIDNFRLTTNKDLGFTYTIFGMKMQKDFSNQKHHYTNLLTPIVTQNLFITLITIILYLPTHIIKKIKRNIFTLLGLIK